MRTRKSPVAWKRSFLSLAAAASVAAAPAPAEASASRVTHRTDAVKVGLREAGGAYDHPVLLTRAEAASLLSAIRYSRAETFRWSDAMRVFSPAEAESLAQPVADALARASARERVFFSLDRPVTELLALQSAEITRGELYVMGGSASVAFSAIGAAPDALPAEDADPFAKMSNPDWRIEPMYGQELGGGGRDNWLVLPIRGGRATASAAAPGVIVSDASASSGRAPEVRLAQADAAPAASDSAGGKRSISERLRLLKALKQEGLLTDGEHRAKYDGVVRDLRSAHAGDPVGLLKDMRALESKGLLDAQDYEAARRAVLQDL